MRVFSNWASLYHAGSGGNTVVVVVLPLLCGDDGVEEEAGNVKW